MGLQDNYSIGYISWQYPPHRTRGTGIYAYNLLKTLNKRGHNIAIFTPLFKSNHYNEKQLNYQSEVGPRIKQIQIYELPNPKTFQERIFPALVFSLSTALTIHSLVKSLDLIHIQDWTGILTALTIQNIYRLPYVYTLHNTEINSDLLSNEKITIQNLEHAGLRSAAAITTISTLLKHKIEKFIQNKRRIQVVHGGVDTTLFTPKMTKTEKTPESKVFVIGYVGRLSKEKQVNILITAIRTTLNEVPNLRLVIIGDGPEKQRLKDLTEKYGISSNVHFYGEIPHHDLPKVYHTFDLCVFLGEKESFGLSHLEALSCGVPIITPNTPSLELVGLDHNNIIQLDVISTTDVSNAILRFYKDSISTKKTQKEFNISKKHLSWDIAAKQIETIYSAAIKNSADELLELNHIKTPKSAFTNSFITTLAKIADSHQEVPIHKRQRIMDVFLYYCKNLLLD